MTDSATNSEPFPTRVDAIVIGGGVAGLSAALMLGRARRSVMVVDAGRPRNRTADAVHAVLGHEGVNPLELLRRGRAELERYDVRVIAGTAVSARSDKDGAMVELGSGDRLAARALVLASGMVDGLPDVPGVAELWGSLVLHCPYCHGWEVGGRRLAVIAAGAASAHQAEMVRQWSDDVIFFSNGLLDAIDDVARERLAARGVSLVDAPVRRVLRSGKGGEVEAIVETDDGVRTAVAAVFTAGVPQFDERLLTPLGLAPDPEAGGGIPVDGMNATRAPRVWAAGNLIAPYASIPIAMASGTQAGASANAALVTEDTDRAVALRRTPATFWEERYAATERSWSGLPNAALVETAAHLAPGSALELGCGEGADARWLAERGWRVTALDISPTAVERAAALASASAAVAEAGGGVDARVADLSGPWPVEGEFELVLASFLHSPVALDRAEILRRALARVAPGGRLLVISHAEAPPWAPEEHRKRLRGPTPDADWALLAPHAVGWDVERRDLVTRRVTAPDGEPAEMRDGVLMLRRALAESTG